MEVRWKGVRGPLAGEGGLSSDELFAGAPEPPIYYATYRGA